jgi:hypothetical protein
MPVTTFERTTNVPRKYQVVETTDLRNGQRSFKLYLRGTAGSKPPVEVGIATRDQAERRACELEAAETRT